MSDNSLVSARFLEAEIRRAWELDNEALEGEIRRVMAEYDCGIENIEVQWTYWKRPPYSVVYVPDDALTQRRWIDWHSDNHGWNGSEFD